MDKRRRYIVFLAVVLVLAFPLAAVAQQSITILVNGKAVASDVPPQIINGRTMVPIRFVAEALGAKVDFDNSTKTVIIETAPATDEGLEARLKEEQARAAQAESSLAAAQADLDKARAELAAAREESTSLRSLLDANATALQAEYNFRPAFFDIFTELAASSDNVHAAVTSNEPTVIGRVLDASGQALPGAMVIYGGRYLHTDAAGWFVLSDDFMNQAIADLDGDGMLDFIVAAPGHKVWGDPHVMERTFVLPHVLEVWGQLRDRNLPDGPVILPPIRLEEGVESGAWLDFSVKAGEAAGTSVLRAGFQPAATDDGETRVLAFEPSLGRVFPLSPVGDLVWQSTVALNVVRFSQPNALVFNVLGAGVFQFNSESDFEITMPDGANDLHFKFNSAVNIQKAEIEVEPAGGGAKRTNPCATMKRNNTGSPELENCNPPFAAGDKVKVTVRSTANEFKALKIIATKDGKELMELRATDDTGLKWGPPPPKKK